MEEQTKKLEKEIKKEAFIIYRNNHLFEKYIPVVEETLTSLGYNITKQVFPAGTPKEEIGKWCIAHKKELKLRDLLADNTTKISSNYKLKPRIEIDCLIDDATHRAIYDTTFDGAPYGELGEISKGIDVWDSSKLERNLAIEEKKAKAIIKRIQRDIKKVYIVEYRITEHSPFLGVIRDGSNVQEFYQKYAALIKTWLDDCVVDSKIVKYPKELPDNIEELEGHYVLYDRHLPTSLEYGKENFELAWGGSKWTDESQILVLGGYYNDQGNYCVTGKGLLFKKGLKLPWTDFYTEVNNKFKSSFDPKESGKVEGYIRQIIETKLTSRKK